MFTLNLTPQTDDETKSRILRSIYRLGQQYDWNPSIYVNGKLEIKTAFQHSIPQSLQEPVVTLEEALNIFYQEVNGA